LAPLVERAIGIDICVKKSNLIKMELISADLKNLPIADGSIDLIYSRSVLEHLDRPEAVFAEFARVLRIHGRVICLTPNKWDYGSLIAIATPNSWHATIVKRTEGRDHSDVFPTYYRANTKRRF